MKNLNYFFRTLLFLHIIFFSFTIKAQTTASYNITFTSVWNPTDHGTLPANAHWSKLIGANHNTINEFLEEGMLATLGVKNVAETGNNTIFTNEINTSISLNNSEQLIQMSSVSTATGSITISDVTINEEFPLLTLISMIAPSPDWFIAINSYDLRSSGDWIENVEINLFPYDAGTDSGNTYTASNLVTSPQGVIANYTNVTPFNDQRIGYLTLNLNSVLATEDENIFKIVQIFPNPTKGIINFKNNQLADLKKLQVFDILGNLVNEFDVKTTENNSIDLGKVSKGIYLVKMISNSGKIKVQKLIIE